MALLESLLLLRVSLVGLVEVRNYALTCSLACYLIATRHCRKRGHGHVP